MLGLSRSASTWMGFTVGGLTLFLDFSFLCPFLICVLLYFIYFCLFFFFRFFFSRLLFTVPPSALLTTRFGLACFGKANKTNKTNKTF